jgi:serine/threonine protein kinase
MSGFLVVGLHVTAYSASVLDTIDQRIPLRMPENDTLCNDLLARLKAVHEAVALHPDDAIRAACSKILVRFVKLLREKPLLFRLARSDTTLAMIRELHGLLDDIVVKIGEVDSSSWEENWEQGCIEQRTKLPSLVSGKSAFSLTRSFESDKQLKEALLLLRGALAVDHDSPLHDLRQSTLNLVLQSKGIMDLRRYEWFISRDDVDYDDESIGLVGTFAAARRGSWLCDGQRQDVVVKTLFFDTDGQDAEDLLGQLVFWYNLPPHENVLKLLGGSHVSSPPFFVCEDAHNGNLLDFLAAEENRGHFWSLFLDVAKGLKHLHQQNIVHGGLKGTNILVGDDNTAKIADFGFSCVRSVSLRLSDKGSKALSAAIRWKARELLAEAAPGEPRFEADVYALGMCMVEAITQEIPFGMEDDDKVTESGLHGELPPRPDQAPEEMWDFICKLCAEDYHARPSIDEVIATLSANLENDTPWTISILSTNPSAKNQSTRDRSSPPSPRSARVSSMASFPIDGLQHNPSSSKTLKDLTGRCRLMPEIEQLTKHILHRLQLLHDDVANVEVAQPRAKYCDVVVRLLKLVRHKPLLLRLASSETLVLTIRGLQDKVSDVAQLVGRADEPELNKWQESWDEDRALQVVKLQQLVTDASGRMLVNQFRGDKKVQEALMALNSGISWKGQSPEMLELKKTTFARVSSYLGGEGVQMFDWFIPIDDVEFEAEAVGSGAFGEVRRGTWLHDGQRTEVAVKLLFRETSSVLDNAFQRQLQLWWSFRRASSF